MARRARRTGRGNLFTNFSSSIASAVTSSIFIVSILLAYYFNTNQEVLKKILTGIAKIKFLKFITDYMTTHLSQTIGLIPMLGASFALSAALQTLAIIISVALAYQVYPASTTLPEYIASALCMILLGRARTLKAKAIVVVFIGVLATYEIIKLPNFKST